MAEPKSIKVGTRVQVVGKDVIGTVAYVGTTLFSSGKWIGVVLDDSRGKNNGTVQGKRYFSCADNRGIFVRQSQLTVVEEKKDSSDCKLSLDISDETHTLFSAAATPTRLSVASSKLASTTVCSSSLPVASSSKLPITSKNSSKLPTSSSLTTKHLSVPERSVAIAKGVLLPGNGISQPSPHSTLPIVGGIERIENTDLNRSSGVLIRPSVRSGKPRSSLKLGPLPNVSRQTFLVPFSRRKRYNSEDSNGVPIRRSDRLDISQFAKHKSLPPKQAAKTRGNFGIPRLRKNVSVTEIPNTMSDSRLNSGSSETDKIKYYKPSDIKNPEMKLLKKKEDNINITSEISSSVSLEHESKFDLEEIFNMRGVTEEKLMLNKQTFKNGNKSLEVLEENGGGSSSIPAAAQSSTPSVTSGPPRASSMQDIAKQQKIKQQNRLSAQGLRTPGIGKMLFSPKLFRRRRSGVENVSSPGNSGTSTPKRKESSPTPCAESIQAVPTVPSPIAAATRKAETPPDGKPDAPRGSPHSPETVSLSQVSVANLSGLTSSISDKMENLQMQKELENMKGEVTDLEEKLETLKVKRSEDKAKLKDFEKLKIQQQQLMEYKAKMQETQVDLQRQLQAARKEVKDIQESYERYKDDMSDLVETVEIATLDKEMAEEKCEALQQEVQSMKEKIEELNLDIQIMREEMNTTGPDCSGNKYQVKQLEQQNGRLKEALIKMRDLSNQEKQDAQRMHKQLEKISSELAAMSKTKEKLEQEVSQLQEEVLDLKEQVDAAQGAEEMVEQLTEKTLQQEERLHDIEEEKRDLETLCDMNDELQENARENELELREEVDMASSRATEANRKLEAMQESIADYDLTITKFRHLVSQLQESNHELRSKQETGTVQQDTPMIDLMDFKTKFAESKAHAKAIDMELRKLDAEQANRHVTYLGSFMPSSFFRRGGDHDSVLVLLFIPRLVAKIELLLLQIREKFDVPDTITRDHVLKTHQSDSFSFASDFIHSLCILQASLKQYDSALNACSEELFLKIGTLWPELAVYEKNVDKYVELLRKDQLDENASIEPLMKAIQYFQHLFSVHLSQTKLDCTVFMADKTRIMLTACDCLHIDSTRIKLSLQPGQEMSDLSILLRDLENFNSDIRLAARKIKRRIPQQDGPLATPLSFGNDVKNDLEYCVESFGKVVKTVQDLSTSTMQLSTSFTGEQKEEEGETRGLQAKKVEPLIFQAYDNIFGKEDEGPLQVLRQTCSKVSNIMKKLAVAMENGEYDFDGTNEKEPFRPVATRAMKVKMEFADSENIKMKLEMKEDDVKELKRQLKLKQEEISSQQVRVGLVEKRLENASKDSDEKVEKIQRKLDEAHLQLKQKEKDFDVTMDALRDEIDTLEAEKNDLREKFKALSKKTLMEGLTRQTNQPSSPSLMTSGMTPSMQESPLLLTQVQYLQDALKTVKHENVRLMSQTIKNTLSKLTPLKVPRKPTWLASLAGSDEKPEKDESTKDFSSLSRETQHLLSELYTLAATPKIVDITKRKPGVDPMIEKDCPTNQLVNNTAKLARLQNKVTELQVKVTNLLAANRPGGQVRTDFAAFPTPAFARLLHEKTVDSKCIGTVTIPSKPGQSEVIPIHLTPQQLKVIHSRLSS